MHPGESVAVCPNQFLSLFVRSSLHFADVSVFFFLLAWVALKFVAQCGRLRRRILCLDATDTDRELFPPAAVADGAVLVRSQEALYCFGDGAE